jgi:isoleucyl-tRNA synthetase
VQEGSANRVDDLRLMLLVSQVDFLPSAAEVEARCPEFHASTAVSEVAGEVAGAGAGGSCITVGVARAAGHKCERCWYYSETVGADATHSDLCGRCADVMRADGHQVTSTAASE